MAYKAHIQLNKGWGVRGRRPQGKLGGLGGDKHPNKGKRSGGDQHNFFSKEKMVRVEGTDIFVG